MKALQTNSRLDGERGDPIVTPNPQPAPVPKSRPGATPSPPPVPPQVPVPGPSSPYRPTQPPPVPLPALPRPTLPAPPEPVGAARYTTADYAGAAQALLPRGRVWPTEPSSAQATVLAAIGRMFERPDAKAYTLLEGALPGSALSPLLPEWEATLDLPDPCAGAEPDFAARRDQVRARFAGGGGQSRGRFVTYARDLGFRIAITNFSPFRVGHSSIAQPIADEAWIFVWGVTVIENTGMTPRAVLECEFEALKPAGTAVIFLN